MGRFKAIISKSSYFNKIHRYLYLGWVLFFFLLVYPALWYYKKDKDRYYSQLVKLRRWIARKSAFLAGFKFKVNTETEIDWSKNYVICANHTSNLDISALMTACNIDFSFIGKEELLQNPVTALFFKTIDIPVNRSSNISSFRAFKKAQTLLENGKSIVIFPEGGIDDHYPPQLSAFKIGAFKLAMDSNIPILPIVVHDAWKLCLDDGVKHGTSPGLCSVTILEPMHTENFLNAEELCDETYKKIQNIWRPQMVTI